MDRRSLMKTALLVLAGGPLALKNSLQISAAQAREPATWRHGLSKLSNLKYSAGFKHFDYVNAERPERWHRVANRARKFRQLQSRRWRREGHFGERH